CLVDSAVGVAAARGQDVAAGGAHVNPSSVGIRRGLQPARPKLNLDAGAGGDADGVRRGDSPSVFPAGRVNPAVRFAGFPVRSTTLISVQWMAQLATGQRPTQSAICLLSLVARVTQDLMRGCLPALQEPAPHSHIQFPSTATTPNTGRMGPKRSAMAIRVDIRRDRLRSAKLSLAFEFMVLIT